MKRITLFHFYKEIPICLDHIHLLRRYGKELEIHGLYGGPQEELGTVWEQVSDPLESLFCLPTASPRWKWMHNDLGIRYWYREFGRFLSFDVLVVIEWDLAVFAPLSRVYAHVPTDAVAVTAPVPLEQVADRWMWGGLSWWRDQLTELLAVCERRHGYRPQPIACLNVGAQLPRTFLDAYAAEKVPELCHDELRLPLFASLLGFPLLDTGFYPDWFDTGVEELFNCDRRGINRERIVAELRRSRGRRVFHPVTSAVADLAEAVA